MSISTWSELKTAIENWSNRNDISSYTADFITLCEGRLNDELLLKNSESEESLTLTQDQNYVALPAGYVSPIALWLIVDGERVMLDQVLPQQLPYETSSTQPQQWAIDGANIRFDCPADEAYSAKFRMMKASNLSGSNTTNYLLSKRPDLYLAGCMVEYCRWAKDPDLMMWEGRFQEAKHSTKAAESRSRQVTLATEFGSGARSNILRGD